MEEGEIGEKGKGMWEGIGWGVWGVERGVNYLGILGLFDLDRGVIMGLRVGKNGFGELG